MTVYEQLENRIRLTQKRKEKVSDKEMIIFYDRLIHYLQDRLNNMSVLEAEREVEP